MATSPATNFMKTMAAAAMNVLFVSDRNAARSLIAEAILRVEGNGRFRAFSAGIEPAVARSAEVASFLVARHLPVEGLRPKSLAELEARQAFDFVITLSPRAAAFAEQHAWQGEPMIAHWALDADEGDGESRGSSGAMRDAFWALSRRIRIFTSLPHRKATRRTIQNRLHALQAV